ncbi:hypothetical protein BGX31_007548, partial [Mortierella sp. GBA43]
MAAQNGDMDTRFATKVVNGNVTNEGGILEIHGDQHNLDEIETKLLRLRQHGRTMTSYMSSFRAPSARLKDGLSNEVKNTRTPKLTPIKPRPTMKHPWIWKRSAPANFPPKKSSVDETPTCASCGGQVRDAKKGLCDFRRHRRPGKRHGLSPSDGWTLSVTNPVPHSNGAGNEGDEGDEGDQMEL